MNARAELRFFNEQLHSTCTLKILYILEKYVCSAPYHKVKLRWIEFPPLEP